MKMSLSLEELASVLSLIVVTCEILAVREWTTLVIVKNSTIVAHIRRRYNLQLTTDVEMGN